MVSIHLRLPILLSSYYYIINSNINYNLIRLYSICLIFFSQIIPLSSSKFDDQVLDIVHSMDGDMCRNYVFTCLFRQRYHKSFDNQQQTGNCKYLLILHSCLQYDTDITGICYKLSLNRAKSRLDNDSLKHCFTSSVYKNFHAQHLRSIAPTRTIMKCQIFVLFFLLISFVIKIRACC
ncbi:unnamed protein product [Adineta steineri]|uniref:Uncharacterized protein n=1 Tax=Adineta steineri TaxID=433720 RepID=A0A814LC18_9BILA|nr:unnamed protein product [Adineta steineri]CAF1005009.1 unnamed protein product [Adineta steineri]CAF1011072.1 unnamed protein product [Adineta steineri]CAF1063081.1 unnamed protein product [Adineta steineri]CAF3839993.1 unnamed protein product [Adineta steineri]